MQLRQHPGSDPPPFNTSIKNIKWQDGEAWLAFDETWCYPIGGGQPADIGEIEIDGTTYLFDRVKKADSIFHRVKNIEAIAIEIGTDISVSIDVEWRNRIARMHTAQHLVSAAAHELFNAPTIGNQIGFDKTRIDLGVAVRESFSKEELEAKVRELSTSRLAVDMSFRSLTELQNDPLVRVNLNALPKHVTELRTITIEDVDICPCAGTHVANTGKIGEIEVVKVKSKGRGKLRVEYIIND